MPAVKEATAAGGNGQGALDWKQLAKGRINYISQALREAGLVVPILSLVPDPDNARLHPERNMEAVKESLVLYGQVEPLVVRTENRMIAAGNGRREAMLALGWTECAVVLQSMTDAEFHGFALTDNRTAELAKWDFQTVSRLQKLLADTGHGGTGWTGWTRDELEILRMQVWEPPDMPGATAGAASLADRFGVPPFSVLDARQGYWQSRKRAWLSLGIQSELGRGAGVHEYGDVAVIKRQNGAVEPDGPKRVANATPGGSLLEAASLGADGHTVRGDGRGRAIDNGLFGFSEQARRHYRAGEARTFGSGGPSQLAAEFKQRTLGAIAPNQGGENGILTRTGSIAARQMLATPYGCIGAEDDTSRRNAAATPGGLAYGVGEWVRDTFPGQSGLPTTQTGTSIFDPVLCELAYRWFCPPDGTVLDPFAGGSVRGVVATKLGRDYVGIELSPPQLAANEAQAELITPARKPRWVLGDARDAIALACEENGGPAPEYDFLFSCPPYFDLECYSDDPRDLSAIGWEEFLVAYRQIVSDCCELLRRDSFACFVVGDIRDWGTGVYRNFVGETVAAFADAGLSLYNEAILVTAVGSLSIRVGKQFASYRKLGKTHQNVLVFVKGDWRAASAAVGPVEMGDVEGLDTDGELGVADE